MIAKIVMLAVFLVVTQGQLHSTGDTNPDGSKNIQYKLPLGGNDNNLLSAIGSANGLKNGEYGSFGGGLQLENENGHSLSLTETHIPSFGDQLTAAGRVNLLHNDNHDLNANAFATHNQPLLPEIPNYNTYGGSFDYTYKDRIGASLGASHTPLFQKTDYSALGHLNIFKDPTQSLDLNAGASRSYPPYIPKSNWEPTFGMTYKKYF